jgi:hypothetical protein
MAVEYDIAPGTPEDVPAILALQEEPLSGSGGNLSARLPADWFERAMQKMPLLSAVATARLSVMSWQPYWRRKCTSRSCKPWSLSFRRRPTALFICVAASERGKGLAGLMFAAMRARLPGRAAMNFIRSDNVKSLRAHANGQARLASSRLTASAKPRSLTRPDHPNATPLLLATVALSFLVSPSMRSAAELKA